MRRARWMVILAVATLAGRADAQDYRVKLTLPGGTRLPIALDTVGVPYEVDAPKSKVFSAVSEVMTDLEIPIVHRDYPLGYIGNAKLQLRTFFAGSQLSRYVECGLGALGPNANAWRVHMGLITFVDSIAPNKSRVRIAMSAGAIDPGGATKDPSMCGSTGVLEEKVKTLLGKKL
jgi:hypothetical protein